MFEFLFDNIVPFFTLVILTYSGLYFLISRLSFNEKKSFFEILLVSAFGFGVGVVIAYLIFPRSCPSCEIRLTVWDTFLRHCIVYIPVLTMVQVSVSINFFRKKTA